MAAVSGVRCADLADLRRGLRRLSAPRSALAGLVAILARVQGMTDAVPEWWFMGPSARERPSSPKDEPEVPCETVTLPGGQTAIVCSRGRSRIKKCGVCGRLSSRLCDFKVGPSGTCDKPLCMQCTTRLPGDKDACPEHAQACLDACRRLGVEVPA